MKYFHYLDKEKLEKIFYIKPQEIILDSEDKEVIAYSLGAALYIPANRENILKDIKKNIEIGLNSVVLCLEDSITDDEVETSIDNIFVAMTQLQEEVLKSLIDIKILPLIFIRVRDNICFEYLLQNIQKLQMLTGFVFPKFNILNGHRYLDNLARINEVTNKTYYGMPILESPEIIYKESRQESLIMIKAIIDNYKKFILNIRIGATDFSGIYSLRREYDQTVYNLVVLRDCICDIINIFLRADSEYVVSGPVWEYFSSGTRFFEPLLIENNFVNEMGDKGIEKCDILIDKYIDGLIKEAFLDKANGLNGKTVIHPTHISVVNAIQVVTKEEYEDANSIINSSGKKGVFKSYKENRMNETKPHTNWARKILIKAKIYGVLNEGRNYTSLFL